MNVTEIDDLIDLLEEAMDGLDAAVTTKALDDARALAIEAREAIDVVRAKLGYRAVFGRSIRDLVEEYVFGEAS